MTEELHQRARKISTSSFVFQFVEGTLIQALKSGEWILLDEINLASESLLNRVSTLLSGEHILLNERADIIETERHPEFRVFLCMNPPYTSAGKKQLPWGMRSRVTERYVEEVENKGDLEMIIGQTVHSGVNKQVQMKILEFYMQIRA